jgi:hypothetical protein
MIFFLSNHRSKEKTMEALSGATWLVTADKICDYIPVVSTATNLINLYQKCVSIPELPERTITESHYFTHLQQKDFERCIILLVPIIGNILIGFLDIGFFQEEFQVLVFLGAIERKDAVAIKKYNDNTDLVLQAIIKNPKAYEYASIRLKRDRDFYTRLDVENQATIFLNAIQKHDNEIISLFNDNREVIIKAISLDSLCQVPNFISERLKASPSVKAITDQKVKECALNFLEAIETKDQETILKFNDNKEVMKMAFSLDSQFVVDDHLSQRLREDGDINWQLAKSLGKGLKKEIGKKIKNFFVNH